MLNRLKFNVECHSCDALELEGTKVFTEDTKGWIGLKWRKIK